MKLNKKRPGLAHFLKKVELVTALKHVAKLKANTLQLD